MTLREACKPEADGSGGSSSSLPPFVCGAVGPDGSGCCLPSGHTRQADGGWHMSRLRTWPGTPEAEIELERSRDGLAKMVARGRMWAAIAGEPTPASPEAGSQTFVPQAPASGGVQDETESAPAVEAPAVGDRGWWYGLGPGELAETAERLQEEIDALRAAAQRPPEPPPDVTLRAVAAVLDLMERPGVDIVARVALLVGEVRTLRAALARWV